MAVVALLGVACISDSDGSACDTNDVPAHDARTIVMEGDPWSGYAVFREPELLAGTDYTAVYVEQLCQEDRAEDLTEGRADIMLTTLDQYILNQPDGTVVGVIDQSDGADALTLNTVDYPYLEGVDDIPRLVGELRRDDDRRPVLAYTGNSPSEMLLNELANTVDELRLSDFELVAVDQSADALRMMQDDEAQLAVLWEPDTSAAEAQGFTVALSSADVPDSIVDVIVASNDLIARDPEAVPVVLRAFYSAMDRYLAEPAELEELVSSDGNIDAAAARSVIEGIKLYGAVDADTFMNRDVFPLDQPQVEQSLEAIGSVLALTHDGIDIDQAAIDGRYVAALAAATAAAAAEEGS